MTTGTIIFLVLIAVLVLTLGLAVILQCCDIRSSITEFREQTYKEEILRLMRRPKQPESGDIFKSSLSPESVTLKGTTPPLCLSDIELRKYCIEQTNKDQVYLRIEDAQRLYEYILNGRQERKEESNGEF